MVLANNSSTHQNLGLSPLPGLRALSDADSREHRRAGRPIDIEYDVICAERPMPMPVYSEGELVGVLYDIFLYGRHHTSFDREQDKMEREATMPSQTIVIQKCSIFMLAMHHQKTCRHASPPPTTANHQELSKEHVLYLRHSSSNVMQIDANANHTTPHHPKNADAQTNESEKRDRASKPKNSDATHDESRRPQKCVTKKRKGITTKI